MNDQGFHVPYLHITIDLDMKTFQKTLTLLNNSDHSCLTSSTLKLQFLKSYQL